MTSLFRNKDKLWVLIPMLVVLLNIIGCVSFLIYIKFFSRPIGIEIATRSSYGARAVAPILEFPSRELVVLSLSDSSQIKQKLESIGISEAIASKVFALYVEFEDKRKKKQDLELSEVSSAPPVIIIKQLKISFANLDHPTVTIIREDQQRGVTSEVIAIAKDSGDYFLSFREQKTSRKERIFTGTIQNGLIQSIKKSGAPKEAVDEIADLFSDRVDFNKDVKNGDKFTIIIREGAQKKRGIRSILACAIEVKGKILTAIQYIGADSKPRYFDESGLLIANTFLRYPVKFSRISSTFTHARFHPILKRSRPHHGVDFAAPVGTPVRTVGSGIVEQAEFNREAGNMVKIKHNQQYSTVYFHLSRIAAGIKKGVKVTRGSLIGYLGSTGLSTGPHLHFGLFDRGKYVDPLKAKLPIDTAISSQYKIDGTYLKRALFTLNHFQSE